MTSLKTKICSFIATLGPVGSLPMPGTFGSLCAIPLLFGVRRIAVHLKLAHQENFVLLVLVLASWWIIDQALKNFTKHDPSEIVLDEVVGYFVTMIYLPLEPLTLLLAFAYFRFFDIVKPLGIDRLEHISGSWGIVLDDVVAGIWAHICLVIALKILL